MAVYNVVLLPTAAREYRKLPTTVRTRISQALLTLEADPRPAGAKKLSNVRDRWRIRVGDYRIIYRIEDDTLIVSVLRVAHRREAYR